MKKLLLFMFAIISFQITLPQEKTIMISYKGKQAEVFPNKLCLYISKDNKDKAKKYLNESSEEFSIDQESEYGFYTISIKDQADINSKIEKLYGTGVFNIVEPAFVYRPFDVNVIPNDPLFTDGQQYSLNIIKMQDAWNITKGSPSVKIGVLDSGVPISEGKLIHEDLNDASRFLLGYDAVQEGLNDVLSHGSHILGIIGASSNNLKGITGINWVSPIRISKVFNSTRTESQSQIASAIIDACDNGVRIINISFGNFRDVSDIFKNAIAYTQQKNVLVIAAAGNGEGSSYDVRYPAKYASSFGNVIAVASTDQYDRTSTFSCFGPEVTISAPGESIKSTVPVSWEPTGYLIKSGTSQAAPIVTGVASLMCSVNPNLLDNPQKVKEILQNTSQDLGYYGKDNYFGYGRINAYRAVRAAQMLNNISNSKFIKISKSSNLVLERSRYNIVFHNRIYIANRYYMEVELDISQYVKDVNNSLIWFNSSGYDPANPVGNNTYYQIISQNGNIIKFRTYDYELYDELMHYCGWITDPANMKIEFLAYGQSLSDPPSIPQNCQATYNSIHPEYCNIKFQWAFNPEPDIDHYIVEERIKYNAEPDWRAWYEPSYGTVNSNTNYYFDSHYNHGGTNEDLDAIQFRVRAVDKSNRISDYSQIVEAKWDAVINKSKNKGAMENSITEYSLKQNYPNPFNPNSTIGYDIPFKSYVKLIVYDAIGREITTLVDELKDQGSYTVNFNASNLPSGMYFYRLKAGDYTATKKMVLAK